MTASRERVASIQLRDIEGIEEMRQVEDLQAEVWGLNDREIIPLTQLVAARATGGILVGAFKGKTMVGFVYGFGGFEEGRPVIHSHMLAVKPSYRNLNLGYRLKLAQRQRALVQGITTITWTFDPLQSLNAHFNLSKLGVVSDRYIINFYGEETSSFLHRIGTDRLWVSWLLESPRVRRRITADTQAEPPPPDLERVPRLIRLGPHCIPERSERGEQFVGLDVVIEIPDDINLVQRRDPNLALEWREATQWAFTQAMPTGFAVRDFYRVSREGQQIGAYLVRAGKGFEEDS